MLYGGCHQGFLVYNKSVAHYTSQKAKYGGLYLYHKRLGQKSDIFSLVAKSCIVYAVNSLAERSERQLRKQLYFGYAKVILNKSTACRQANFTAIGDITRCQTDITNPFADLFSCRIPCRDSAYLSPFLRKLPIVREQTDDQWSPLHYAVASNGRKASLTHPLSSTRFSNLKSQGQIPYPPISTTKKAKVCLCLVVEILLPIRASQKVIGGHAKNIGKFYNVACLWLVQSVFPKTDLTFAATNCSCKLWLRKTFFHP